MSAVRIAELKAGLSEHLRSVREGESITVLDPPGQLEIRKAKCRLSDAKLPSKPARDTDSLGILPEDRPSR